LGWLSIKLHEQHQEKIMSKGPGRVMRSVNAAISAEPKRRFTYEELKAIAYDGPPPDKKYDARQVAVQRAVQSLVAAKRVSLGVDTHSWLRTVRAFDPEARSSASIVNVESVQVSS
jgi:hypothetical protein